MSLGYFHSLLRRLAPGLVLLLLLTQGLRLCIPAVDGPAQHDGVIHLESFFTAAADQHESGHDGDGDTDLTLIALLKLLGPSAAGEFALVFVFLTVLLVCRAGLRFRPDERSLRPPRGSGLTPPSRAPPR